MPTQTPGDPALYPESVPLYDDGDEQAIETVNIALEGLLDRTAWLRARATDPILVDLFAAKQSVPGVGKVERFEEWATQPSPPDSTTERAGWLQTDVTDGGGLWWFIQISSTVQVTTVTAYLDGSDGPGSNPGFPAPADRPLFRVYRQGTDGTASQRLATAADESASQSEYQQHHEIVMSPAPDPGIWPAEFAAGEYLVLEFVGHKGAQVAPGTLKLYGLKIETELP
jgi:hypothetical protein